MSTFTVTPDTIIIDGLIIGESQIYIGVPFGMNSVGYTAIMSAWLGLVIVGL
jgi:hypothetical protein